ncbi:S-adenosyl-L-methionine-dependent methyltransferases superfamily protein [Theobroma cacao]|uniref:S-adenosyl-L-methionine-dependent methyltransferases superfamily protein n=1 Tax=Theobroma cacao TaxID=3641 RepID=A0A061EJV7_THECC|nr:S-adenosyl-L-methionine-dependent methyltransferases superfamily protein [Theobroma cacao]
MLPIHAKPKPWHPSIAANPQTSSPLRFKTRLLPLKISSTLNENEEANHYKAGRIKRLVLTNEGRTKLNTFPDREFYAFPRFVTHVDDGFIATLTDLYRERLRPGSEILDIMSSWISHLPKEVVYKRVDQKLEMEDGSFNAVLCTVSVQYLQQPEKVFAEVFRVLRPGGVFIVSFSNRLFYEKAISAWRDGTAYGRVQLILQYFQCIEGFTQPEVIRKLPTAANAQDDKSPFSWFMKWLGLFSGSDPFYAVIAYKNFKPVYECDEILH